MNRKMRNESLLTADEESVVQQPANLKFEIELLAPMSVASEGVAPRFKNWTVCAGRFADFTAMRTIAYTPA